MSARNHINTRNRRNGQNEYSRRNRKNGKPDEKNNKSKLKKIIFFSFLGLILLSFIGAGSALGVWIGIGRTAEPIPLEKLDLSNTGTTNLYDSNGKRIAKLTASGVVIRKYVTYENIPDNLINAFIAIEDERFYSHNGFDLLGFARAAVKRVTEGSREGGSTITMQLCRGLTLKNDYSYERKFKEQFQAMELEKAIAATGADPKQKVLEVYLNLISLGDPYFGVQAASMRYFDKKIDKLSIAESACLAAIPKSTTAYAPKTKESKANNLARQKIVLSLMLKNKFITQEEYNTAINEKIVFSNKELKYKNAVRSYFVDQVINELRADLAAKDYTEDAAKQLIFGGGLEVHTTIDTSVQKQMNSVFKNSYYFPNATVENQKPQAGMTVIDPSTGYIKGVYGGNGKKTANLVFDRSYMIERQPGSSIKPIAVYAPALDSKTITAADLCDDSRMYADPSNPGKEYPTNAGGYSGWISLRNAVKYSKNVVAARVYQKMGPDITTDYLKRAGIDRDESGISVALGGLTKGVSPRQMAAAYVPFANDGVYIEPITYTKAIESNGNVLVDKETDPVVRQKREYVYDEKTAFLMTDILKAVLIDGTGAGYGNIKNGAIESAGKTGTTNSTKDKWFVGYTPYYVGAVWYGYDTQQAMSDQGQALKIWRAVMDPIHNNKEAAKFKKPKGFSKKNICSSSRLLANPDCPILSEYFLPDTAPKDHCNQHVTVDLCKFYYDMGKNVLAGPSCTIVQAGFVKSKIPKKECDGIHSLPATNPPTKPTPEPPILGPEVTESPDIQEPPADPNFESTSRPEDNE